MRAIFTLIVCAGLLLASGCDTARGLENAAVNRMAKPMIARLRIAEDVAWAKANTGAPVLDAERENALLAELVRQGVAAGVDAGRVEMFFRAQIAASREVQTELLSAWASGRKEKPKTAPLDLRTEIRPRMDAASTALIEALVYAPKPALEQRREGVESRLREAGFSEAVSALAVSGL